MGTVVVPDVGLLVELPSTGPGSLKSKSARNSRHVHDDRSLLTRSTNNFCLFFGPGRAFALAPSSTPSPSSLFVPAFGPDVPFATAFSEGVSEALGCIGGGEDFGSDFAATIFTISVEIGPDGGGAVVVFDTGVLRGFSWGKRESIDGDRVNFTVRLDFEPLPERAVAGGVATLDDEVPRLSEVLVLVFPTMVCYGPVSLLRPVLPVWT